MRISIHPGAGALVGLFFLCFPLVSARAQSQWKENLLRYIHRDLAKDDGGFGWKDQPDSHLTPTFAVVGILHDLGELPPDKKSLIAFVRTHHPQFGAKAIEALSYKQKYGVEYLGGKWIQGSEAGASGSEMRDLIYQQIQSILWLGGNASDYRPLVKDWKSQAGNIANYEKHGYPVMMEYMMDPICQHLLQLPVSDSSVLATYLLSRRRENGSYNNAPTGEGGDGNILNTFWGLYAYILAGGKDTLKNKTIHWLQACQLKSGGFTHQPRPLIGGNDEVAYTWAAIRALDLLQAAPADRKTCIRYLLSLRNSDGGFGNRPGLPSTPIATYYAIDALKTLNALSALDKTKLISHRPAPLADFSRLKVYTVQFEAPGVGSPSEAVMLADSLHIQLWGCKNGPEGWMEKAQMIAREKNVPVTFFTADEPYGKYVRVPGMGSFGHILDFITPPGTTPPAMGAEPSWQQYRENYLRPLLRQGGGLLLQISNNEPLARMLLDESIRKGGYVAISTIHFIQDFLFWVPYLYQYRYQLPFIALQDAHGTESWWWADELLGYRTLFLAKEPTYQAMMFAMKNNWVVAVRHDTISNYKTRILGGSQGVRQYVSAKQERWKWWGLDPTQLNRPWAVFTILRPSDSFEIARPQSGINIRIRCWWQASRPFLITPVVKLVELRVDQRPVKVSYMEQKDKRGRITDSYYLYNMPSPSAGLHALQATVLRIKDHAQKTLKQTFTISEP